MMMLRVICGLMVSAAVGMSGMAMPRIELGALWHDGAFAPFVCITDGHATVGLMRNGTGLGDFREVYLAWIELRGGQFALMLGARINVALAEDSIDTTYHWKLKDVTKWPFWGWWCEWRRQEVFARWGHIYTWHGEGWALWPMIDLGMYYPPR